MWFLIVRSKVVVLTVMGDRIALGGGDADLQKAVDIDIISRK